MAHKDVSRLRAEHIPVPGPRHILLLGANGQLGQMLAQTLTALGTVHALTRAQADLSDALLLARQIEALRHEEKA